MKRALMLLLFSPLLSSAQNVRYDQPFSTISSKYGEPLLVAIVPPNNLAVSVCNSPANAVPCTNYATTFDSLGNPCPNGAQDTPQPQPSACQSTADAQGNIGFWVAPGKYDFTACVGSNCFSSPYTITLSIVGSGTVGGSGTPTFLPKWDTTVALISSALADTGAAIISNEPLILGASPAGACGTSASCIAIGATPPTACGTAGSCIAWSEASAAGTPTAGQDYIRADSVTHSLLKSFNGAAESAFGGGSGTVTGTGTTNKLAKWTSSSAIGDSGFSDNGTTISTTEAETISRSSSGLAFSVTSTQAGASATCNSGSVGPPVSIGCTGSYFEIDPNGTAPLGTSAAVKVAKVNNIQTELLGIGLLSTTQNTAAITDLRSVSAESYPSGTGAITTNTAVHAFASNNTGTTMASNRGVYVVTGTDSFSSAVTNDYGVLVDSPIIGTGALTHHYGLYLADQTVAGSGTNPDPWGIFEAGTAKNQLGGPLVVTNTIQTTAVTFATLPACAGGTEGSRRAVTDSTTTTWGATITGGGANHVLGYCNGTNWTVMAK